MPFADIDAFLKLGGPVRVIAHRGFSAVAPENTLAAFRRAIEAGADMIELDVLASRDGAIVVIHDEALDRTTNGTGPVAERDLVELKRLDAGSWFGTEFANERIPTLEEVLELAGEAILVNIEIKTEAVVEETLALVERTGMMDRVVVSSFDPRALTRARQLNASVRTASLRNARLHEGWAPLRILDDVGSGGLNVSLSEVDESLIEACHRAGRPVSVYTVNELDDVRRLVAMGVDAIFTDHPDRLLHWTRG